MSAPPVAGIDALLRCEIEDLYARYARATTPEHLDRWPELFEERCLYTIRTRENAERGLPLALMRCESAGMLRDRVVAIRKTVMFQPRVVRTIIGNLLIESGAHDRVETSADFIAVHTLADEEPRVLASGHCRDVIVRTGGRWRFVVRDCVLDCDTVPIPGSIVYPV